MTSHTAFRISNRVSGQDLGTYEATGASDALQRMAEAAGYDSVEHMGEIADGGSADLVVDEIVVEEG